MALCVVYQTNIPSGKKLTQVLELFLGKNVCLCKKYEEIQIAKARKNYARRRMDGPQDTN